MLRLYQKQGFSSLVAPPSQKSKAVGRIGIQVRTDTRPPEGQLFPSSSEIRIRKALSQSHAW